MAKIRFEFDGYVYIIKKDDKIIVVTENEATANHIYLSHLEMERENSVCDGEEIDIIRKENNERNE